MAKPNKAIKFQSSPSQQPKVPVPSTPQPIQNVQQQRPAVNVTLSHQDIAKRAEEIYFQKGCPQGQDEQIWLQAEKELRNRKMAVSVSR